MLVIVTVIKSECKDTDFLVKFTLYFHLFLIILFKISLPFVSFLLNLHL